LSSTSSIVIALSIDSFVSLFLLLFVEAAVFSLMIVDRAIEFK
jgi:hypothetical protein